MGFLMLIPGISCLFPSLHLLIEPIYTQMPPRALHEPPAVWADWRKEGNREGRKPYLKRDLVAPFFSLFSFDCAARLAGSWLPDQGLNPGPQQWKRWVTQGIPSDFFLEYRSYKMHNASWPSESWQICSVSLCQLDDVPYFSSRLIFLSRRITFSYELDLQHQLRTVCPLW